MEKIDHIGYLTGCIKDAVMAFRVLGYFNGEIVDDDIQQTHICFLFKEDEIPIELVQPFEDNHSMQRMLSKRGDGPYHVCYSVDDINLKYEELVNEDWIPLFKPVAASALGGRLICYFFKREVGLVEFVNNR